MEPYDENLALLRDALEIIQWMSGSADFAPGGMAHLGWQKSQDKLNEIRDVLKKHSYAIR